MVRGLVYEITWQKYLAILLGSHGEATAAVLAIFLGGLSLGYLLFGSLTRRLYVAAARFESAERRLGDLSAELAVSQPPDINASAPDL